MPFASIDFIPDPEEVVSFSYLLIAGALLLPLAGAAQEMRSAPDPAVPSAPHVAASAGYESAFADYQPFASPKQSPDQAWREANRRVGELGGHMGHLRPAAKETTPPASARPAGSHGHGHH